jgi:thioesterase domain-containing protein
VMIFRELAEAMGENRPVFGLQGIGLDGRELPLRRIEDIAERYLQEITRVQPDGPYFLVGWSMGGIIGYELALPMLDQRRRLGGLVIVDEFAPVEVPMRERIAWHWARFRQQSMGDRFTQIKRILGRRLEVVRKRLGSHPPIPGLEGPTAERVKRNALAQFAALHHYRPRPFPGSLCVIKAEHSAGAADPRAKDPAMGWGSLVRGRLVTDEVPGSHGGIFTGENVRILRSALDNCFKQLDGMPFVYQPNENSTPRSR